MVISWDHFVKNLVSLPQIIVKQLQFCAQKGFDARLNPWNIMKHILLKTYLFVGDELTSDWDRWWTGQSNFIKKNYGFCWWYYIELFSWDYNPFISGWWFQPTPLKHDGVRQLGWWHSQYMDKYNSCPKPPTSNQYDSCTAHRGNQLRNWVSLYTKRIKHQVHTAGGWCVCIKNWQLNLEHTK
jgi:hypothetical protein